MTENKKPGSAPVSHRGYAQDGLHGAEAKLKPKPAPKPEPQKDVKK